MQVQGMTAKELLQQLLELQRERSDFDDLPVYIEIIDQESYKEDQIKKEEYNETVIGEGTLYAVVVPEGFVFEDDKTVSTGHYLLLQGAEDEEEGEEAKPGTTGGMYEVK